ncbi:2-alkenal reductase (NADP(+)-dependent) [Quillaja saponaria]|uniref:2-alkenal reductase (NADP(+)-dependent) n=1 Tax=Quillaja saponaria TaxID=32244 RepID=A0AAD7PAI5_QUISA|nr:2-alkenal reductase (NADP(+)-dependent) [Quillaja saponaria]
MFNGGRQFCSFQLLESREWYLAAYASDGVPNSDHLKLRNVKLSLAADSIPDRHVAVETLFLAVDPYLRSQMNGRDDGLYLPQFQLNQVIKSFGIGRVILSKDDKYGEGDIVLGPIFPIAEYFVAPSEFFVRKIEQTNGISLLDYLTPLGTPGFAAWVGIELKGCRVIGSTGSDEKVKLIKEEFGYDDGFNYNKETDFEAALSKHFPNGIDIYLDNVGGKMLEAVLNHVNKKATVSICGMMSEYNKVWTEREGIRNLLNVVGKEVRIEGFMIGSYLNRFGEFAKEMEEYMKEGKLKYKNKINNGIESFLESLRSLFSSSNVGKVIIQVKAN